MTDPLARYKEVRTVLIAFACIVLLFSSSSPIMLLLFGPSSFSSFTSFVCWSVFSWRRCPVTLPLADLRTPPALNSLRQRGPPSWGTAGLELLRFDPAAKNWKDNLVLLFALLDHTKEPSDTLVLLPLQL